MYQSNQYQFKSLNEDIFALVDILCGATIKSNGNAILEENRLFLDRIKYEEE